MMESTNTNATEMEDASPRSDSSRPSTPGKSPKPTKSPKQAHRQTRNVMPLFGKEAAETAKLLRELRVVSDAGLNSDNYGKIIMRARNFSPVNKWEQEKLPLFILPLPFCSFIVGFFGKRLWGSI